jgi:putative Mg2+ transporter-C (MgtC) family protein
MSPDDLDIVLRLLAATGLGMVMGLERFLRGKPTGMRTLGLVSFGAALVTLATSHAPGIAGSPDALSRVLQGVDQGVLVGIGFLGGGIILRDIQARHVKNVTTAAEVWAIAALGLATAVAPWAIIGLAYTILAAIIILLRIVELRLHLKDGHPDDA